jgi:hypothetical protein
MGEEPELPQKQMELRPVGSLNCHKRGSDVGALFSFGGLSGHN